MGPELNMRTAIPTDTSTKSDRRITRGMDVEDIWVEIVGMEMDEAAG
jgi:hypothetical protein